MNAADVSSQPQLSIALIAVGEDTNPVAGLNEIGHTFWPLAV